MKRRLADRLIKTRKEQGLSQSALAELAGVSQTIVYKLENRFIKESRKIPSIAKALGVTQDWLVHGDKENISDADAIAIEEAEIIMLKRIIREAKHALDIARVWNGKVYSFNSPIMEAAWQALNKINKMDNM